MAADAAAGVKGYDALAVTNLVERFTNVDPDAAIKGSPLKDGSELTYKQKVAVAKVLEKGAEDSYRPKLPGVGEVSGSNTVIALGPLRAATPDTTVDPSYFQAEVGYILGNTAVAVSWYQSQDFVRNGSKGTAIVLGATHSFPKAGAQVYAAVENFDVTPGSGAGGTDGTLFMIGTRVSF